MARRVTYVALAQGLELRVAPSSLIVLSDPQLLEQMVRNLLANALKYTRTGKVLVGCRRHNDEVVIAVIDTGIGIPKRELDAIFEEYHQLHNEARERSLGLGLGLSIVKRLGDLLDHRVSVRSTPDQGSSFSITVPMLAPPSLAASAEKAKPASRKRVTKILVVEDDPEIRDLMDLLLRDEGHEVLTAVDGPMARDIITRQGFRPAMIMADFNLPGGMDGIEVIADLRSRLGARLPAIVLSGDISTDALHSINQQDCMHFSKPVKAIELLAAIERLLDQDAGPPTLPAASLRASDRSAATSIVYIVDDELEVRTVLREALESEGLSVLDFASAEAFLIAYVPTADECLLLDAYLPGLSGVELIRELRSLGHNLPTVMITGSSDVTMAVEVMKAGAMDFIEKPVGTDDLLAAVERALDVSKDTNRITSRHDEALGHLAVLTARQRQIMDLVLAGHPSKNIAADLNLSQRTVENHRAEIMRRTGAKSLPGLARIVFAAST
ncbi:MAG: response regulator [Devosia sp.]